MPNKPKRLHIEAGSSTINMPMPTAATAWKAVTTVVGVYLVFKSQILGIVPPSSQSNTNQGQTSTTVQNLEGIRP